MREGWREVAVEDVATVVGGGTPRTRVPEFWDGDVEWLTPKDLSDRPARYTSAGSRSITEAGLRGSGAQLLPPGAVLLTSRAPVGYVSVAAGPIATNQGFKSLILHDSQLPEFWYYLLLHSTDYLRANSGGSTFQELSGGTLKKLRFTIPPLHEQRRIVDLIGALDDTIAGAEESLARAAQTQDRLREMIPEGDSLPIGSVLFGIDSGTSTKPVVGDGAPVQVLSLAAVRPGRFRAAEVKDVGPAQLPAKALLREGDLLITRSNTPERVGYVAVARGVPDRTYIPDLIWRLVVDDSLVSRDYMAQLLSSPTMRARITASATGTSQSMQKINKTNFSALRIPVPDASAQCAYVAPILAFDDVAMEQESTVSNLHALRSNLLTALLSGEHEIPESYDELLEEAS